MPIHRYQSLLDRIDPGEVARVCADLVRLNTANPPGNERRAAEYVGRYLADAGYELRIIDYPGEPDRASALCRLASSHALIPSLMFGGHLDVVPAGAQAWQHPPFSGEIAGGQVWGRGSADMKGGLASLLVAARTVAAARHDLRGDLLVVATAGEEIGMQGAQQIAAWPALGPVGAIIIAEPTANSLGLAERGIFTIEFTTHGQTAHGSTPHLGRNAINMMRRLLDEFDRVAGSHEIPFDRHPVLGEPTYSVNTIEGGVAHNVVPDRCVAVVDMRTVPGQDHKGILRQMEEVIARLKAQDATFDATVGSPMDLPPVDAPDDHAAPDAFLAAAEAATGRRPPAGVVRFATEAAVFAPALHVPVLIFGPGDPAQAHQPDEHAGIAEMAEAARIYAAAALAILA